MHERSRKTKKLRGRKPWKSFSITNFRSLMYPYVFVSSLLGFFPYKIASSKYVLSGGSFAWSTFVALVYTCGSAFSIYQINIANKHRPLFEMMHGNFIIIMGFIIVSVSYVTSRSKLRAFQKVSDVARTLSPQDIRELAPQIFTKDVIKIVPICSYIPYIFVKEILYRCTCWYTFFAALVVITLYVNIIYVLEASLRKINESLTKLRKTLITDEPHLLRRVYHRKRNPMLIRKLKVLRKEHLDITEIVKLLNDSFGIEMIGTVTLMVFDITFNIYSCIVFVLYQDIGGAKLFSVVFMVYYFAILLSIISACECVKDEAQKIGFNIHQILVTTFDEQLAAELELFSVQIFQQHTSFSAMGLPLDAGLLTKMVSTISTYLLMLIQFLLVKSC
ncbi:uncharacterized protein LOC143374928 [Andrena cerasifolii]|uniref:uncharacterized protein LOC143374928 n=1 Tax=Andrena cerasifolii TaxID=2819439 RepID=UPI0040378D1C